MTNAIRIAYCHFPITLVVMTPFSILLIDDEVSIADLFKRVLQQEFPQAQLIAFAHLADALIYLDDPAIRCQTDLIIVDIDLHTDCSGLDLIPPLRCYPSGQLTPVLVLSSQVSSDWIERAYDAGVNSYTNKPDSYAAWKQYVRSLRAYWYDTVTTPSRIVVRKG